MQNPISSWSQLAIQSVFASVNRPSIDLQKMPVFAKKIRFSDEAHYDRLTEDAAFGKKKSYFQMKLIMILAGM